jgi:membrane-associated HD superfamily phosphohydrolase
VAEAEYVQVWI